MNTILHLYLYLYTSYQRLAEESSKATKSDDIFSFQKKQRTRQFVTVGSKKESPSDEITGPVVSGPNPDIGPNPLKDLVDISELQSPGGSNSTTRPGPATRGSCFPEKSKKSSNATYVHMLSKKVSSARHTKSIPVVPAKTTGKLNVKINRKVVQGTSPHGQVSAAIDPRTGRVTVTDKRSSLEDADEDDAEESGSEYLRNMTEEEDGDF
jgi:hypothetical protein